MNKGYTDKEKAAYWKAKASGKSAGAQVYKKKRSAKKSGGYSKPTKSRPPGMLSAGGEMLGGAAGAFLGEGSPLAAKIGSFLGGKIGHLAEQITGFGDYKIESNSIMRGGLTPPQIVNSTKTGAVIIRHREYLGDITASIAFTSVNYYLNPGQKQTFPWLSSIAANFQQYRFRGLIFSYEATSADSVLSSSASTSLGTVSMATDYDVLDNNYNGKREMLNSLFASSKKPSCSFIHPIECDTKQSPMRLQYIRVASYPSDADPRMYDLGKTQIATEGMQAATGSVGELWVTYEVELYKQQLAATAISDLFNLGLVTASLKLGQSATLSNYGSTLGGTIQSGTTYAFPTYVTSGWYQFTYFILGTSATIGALSFTPNAQCNTPPALLDGSLYLQSPASGVASISVMFTFLIEVLAPGAAVTFDAGPLVPTGANHGTLLVTQVASSLTAAP